jgi:predicted nucleotidyltransferase component of viral defense system
MAAHDSYRAQVELLIRCLPAVASAPDLVLKGGTAINLFLRDMPRLSVDIDLTYLPASDRDTALIDMRSQVATIAEGLKQTVPGTNVQLVEGDAPKLLVDKAGARIKVEPSVVIRGSLVPPVTSALCSAAQEDYELFVEIQRLDSPDLYAGKLCAALDRQHRRDLFDVMTFKQRDRSRIPYEKRLLPTSPVTGARSQSYCSRTANQSRACSPTTSLA